MSLQSISALSDGLLPVSTDRPVEPVNSPDILAQQPSNHYATEPFSPETLVEIKDYLVHIARLAGDMMLAAAPSIENSSSKKNSSDRVTKTDHAIETMVHKSLCEQYPTIAFLGEETSKLGEALTDAPTFVCDPIDGTLNFVHGFPNTGPSLALCIKKKPVVGVIFNPFRGDLFSAVKGQGSFVTQADGGVHRLPIRSSTAELRSLNDCLIAVEWGSQREGQNWDLRTTMAVKMMTATASGGAMAHSVRSNGSAALDFCYVAAGWLDCFWEGGVWVWDVAAGWIVLEEAGGIVASANPGDWEPTLEGRLYFAVRAGKKEEQEAVVKELWELMGERKFSF